MASGDGTTAPTNRYLLSDDLQMPQNIRVRHLDPIRRRRANLVGFTGVLTSPKFGQPTSFLTTRKFDFNVGLSL